MEPDLKTNGAASLAFYDQYWNIYQPISKEIPDNNWHYFDIF